MTSMRGALNLLRARMAERRRPIWERTSTPKILSGTNASTATLELERREMSHHSFSLTPCPWSDCRWIDHSLPFDWLGLPHCCSSLHFGRYYWWQPQALQVRQVWYPLDSSLRDQRALSKPCMGLLERGTLSRVIYIPKSNSGQSSDLPPFEIAKFESCAKEEHQCLRLSSLRPLQLRSRPISFWWSWQGRSSPPSPGPL